MTYVQLWTNEKNAKKSFLRKPRCQLLLHDQLNHPATTAPTAHSIIAMMVLGFDNVCVQLGFVCFSGVIALASMYNLKIKISSECHGYPRGCASPHLEKVLVLSRDESCHLVQQTSTVHTCFEVFLAIIQRALQQIYVLAADILAKPHMDQF